jgi:hypothetical protein
MRIWARWERTPFAGSWRGREAIAVRNEADGILGKTRALWGASRRLRPRRRAVARGFLGSEVNAPTVGNDDDVRKGRVAAASGQAGLRARARFVRQPRRIGDRSTGRRRRARVLPRFGTPGKRPKIGDAGRTRSARCAIDGPIAMKMFVRSPAARSPRGAPSKKSQLRIGLAPLVADRISAQASRVSPGQSIPNNTCPLIEVRAMRLCRLRFNARPRHDGKSSGAERRSIHHPSGSV